MHPHGARRALPLLLASFLATCSSNTSPTTATRAVVTVSVSPNPIISARSANPAFDYDIQWTVTITETAGVGGTINFVDSRLFDPATGVAVGSNDLDSTDLLVLTGSNHLAAKGTLSVQQTISYRLPSRGKAALLAVNVEMRDDNQNLIDQSILIQVQ